MYVSEYKIDPRRGQNEKNPLLKKDEHVDVSRPPILLVAVKTGPPRSMKQSVVAHVERYRWATDDLYLQKEGIG